MLNVRVITPVYRFKSEYLRRAIDSVARQDYKDDIEHVIVWDGWDIDRVKNTVQFKIKATQVYCPKKQGVSYARNWGVNWWYSPKLGTPPDLICYVDSDNWMDKSFVSKMVAGYKAMAKPGVFVCAQRVHYYKEILRGVHAEVSSNVRGGYIPANYRELLLDHNWIDLGTIIHPYDPFIKFDTNLTRLVDWDLLIQLAQKYPFDFTTQILSHYRMDAVPWSISKTESFDDNRKKLADKWT